MGDLGKKIKDPKKVSEEYFKVMNKEKAEEMYDMGMKFYEGDNVERDIKKAIDLFNTSAESGNKSSLYMLGRILFYGEENEKNVQQGFYFYFYFYLF